MSSGGITYLVDRLEQKGLVERQDCPGDRRARYAALTPEGERVIGRIFPGHARQIVAGGVRADRRRAGAGDRAATQARNCGRGAPCNWGTLTLCWAFISVV